MWHDLWAALALVLIIEGLLPFASPELVKRLWREMADADPRTLRLAGLMAVAAGLVLLKLVR